ncbi:MAG: hypothetical protein AB7E77_04430 [Desulfobulbus sp.]
MHIVPGHPGDRFDDDLGQFPKRIHGVGCLLGLATGKGKHGGRKDNGTD